ncbi:hypothetical protein MHU86_24669 [Fragilaria crotonensis]|nr:hypothetical protein MHU86_24669 [Fragilaria crotonensis]
MDEATTDHNHADDLFYSDAEMGNLLHIKSEFESEFPVGTVFPTRRQLIDAMRDKASQLGFFVIDRGYSVLCFETTARDSENEGDRKLEKNSRENGKIYVPRKVAKSKCGCEFKASFVQREAPHRMNSGSQRCNTCMERCKPSGSNSRQHGGVVDMHQSM